MHQAPLKARFGARRIGCLLVHDHVLLRQGMRRLLEDEPDLEVVAEAGSAAEALTLMVRHAPQVVVTEAGVFGLPADHLQRLILRVSPQSRVLFLGVQREDDPSRDALAGHPPRAAGQMSAKDLAEMIRGTWPLGKAEVQEMPREIPRIAQEVQAAPPSGKVLTLRERQVLELLAEGKTVRSAAAILGLSVKTVDAHKFNLMRKLGLHNKAELVRWAIQKRIVKLPANF